MDQNEKYEYNFEYSLAQYHRSERKQSENQNQQELQDQEVILRRSNQLIQFSCFKERQIQCEIKTLFTHYIRLYSKVAVRLFRICQKTFQNIQVTSSVFIRNQQEIIDHQREKLVENLTQLCQVFYSEKQKYHKLISLCISGAIFKILTLQKQITELEFQTVFHSVFWQITGAHSTSQMLKKLLIETFDPKHFHSYLLNQQPTKVYKFNSMSQSFKKEDGSFGKSSNILQSVKEYVPKISYLSNYPETMIKEQIMSDELAFSKKIKRKQKLSKQNEGGVMNIKNYREIDKNEDKNEDRDEDSNNKTGNFKKARKNYFQNFSKSKSSKKIIEDLDSNKKVPLFANFLQQRRLNF